MLDIVDFKLVSGQSDGPAKLKLEQQPNSDLKTPNSSFDFISGADADSFSAFLGPGSVIAQATDSVGNAATVGSVPADRSLMAPFECSTLPDIEVRRRHSQCLDAAVALLIRRTCPWPLMFTFCFFTVDTGVQFLPSESSGDDSICRGSAAKKTKRNSNSDSPHTSLQQLPFDDPAYKPLRAGLRNRSRKVVTKFDNSTDVEPAKPKVSRSLASQHV